MRAGLLGPCFKTGRRSSRYFRRSGLENAVLRSRTRDGRPGETRKAQKTLRETCPKNPRDPRNPFKNEAQCVDYPFYTVRGYPRNPGPSPRSSERDRSPRLDVDARFPFNPDLRRPQPTGATSQWRRSAPLLPRVAIEVGRET